MAYLITLSRTIKKCIWCHPAPPVPEFTGPAKTPKITKIQYFLIISIDVTGIFVSSNALNMLNIDVKNVI